VHDVGNIEPRRARGTGDQDPVFFQKEKDPVLRPANTLEFLSGYIDSIAR
jgi:hypothetical protein